MKTWTMRQLKQELRGFEAALKSAGHRSSSITTYVGRSEVFLRWLDGDYVPRGPNATSASRWSRPRKATASPGRIERSHGTPGRVEILSQAHLTSFDWKWPSSQVEHFEEGWELEVKTGGRNHTVRHGLARRAAFGRMRLRSVTWVDGQVRVEGVETDDLGDPRLASLLKINGQKHVKTPAEVPAGYQTFDLVTFSDVVDGPNVFQGLGVRIAKDDLESWARHALLRDRSKTR